MPDYRKAMRLLNEISVTELGAPKTKRLRKPITAARRSFLQWKRDRDTKAFLGRRAEYHGVHGTGTPPSREKELK